MIDIKIIYLNIILTIKQWYFCIKFKFFIKPKKRVNDLNNSIFEILMNKTSSHDDYIWGITFTQQFMNYQEKFIKNYGMNEVLIKGDYLILSNMVKNVNYDYRISYACYDFVSNLFKPLTSVNYLTEREVKNIVDEFLMKLNESKYSFYYDLNCCGVYQKRNRYKIDNK